jgi:hypothetical protein
MADALLKCHYNYYIGVGQHLTSLGYGQAVGWLESFLGVVNYRPVSQLALLRDPEKPEAVIQKIVIDAVSQTDAL